MSLIDLDTKESRCVSSQPKALSNTLQGISALKMLISLHWLWRERGDATSILLHPRGRHCVVMPALSAALFEKEKRKRVKKNNGGRKSEAISKKKTKNQSIQLKKKAKKK